jgi:hypothetical protein
MEMNDNEIFAAVRDSLTAARDSLGEVRMERPARTFEARARTRRRRRGLSGAATGALALGVGLALALTPGGSPALAAHPVHANLAAWSVNTDSGGQVTIVVRNLQDPSELQQKLDDAGIPSAVYFGETCTGEIVGQADQVLQQAQGEVKRDGGGYIKLTVTPSAMPQGAELLLSIAQAPGQGGPGGGQQSGRSSSSGISLVKAGGQISCTSPGASG